MNCHHGVLLKINWTLSNWVDKWYDWPLSVGGSSPRNMYFSSRVYKSTVVKATEWHDQGCYSEQALEAPNEQIQEISFQNISSRERLKTKPRVSKKITTPDWLSRDQR